MRTDLTLRYLLLRHLKILAPHTTEARHRQVANSLCVQRIKEYYFITWEAEGEKGETYVPCQDFVFYKRGDTRPESRKIKDSLFTTNDTKAQHLCRQMLRLKIAPSRPTRPSSQGLTYRYAPDVILLALLFILAPAGSLLAIFLISLYLATRHLGSKERYITPLLLFMMAFSSLSETLLILAPASLLFHFLDPNDAMRPARLLTTAAALGVTLFTWNWEASLATPSIWLAILAPWSILYAAVRIFFGIHENSFSLTAPFFMTGLAISLSPGASFVGHAYLLSLAWLECCRGTKQ